MEKDELSKLLEATQIKQKRDLANFEHYMNQSAAIKRDISHFQEGYSDSGFFIEIIQNMSKGESSNFPLPGAGDLINIYSFLLDNPAYLKKLSEVSLPVDNNIDNRIQHIFNFMNKIENNS